MMKKILVTVAVSSAMMVFLSACKQAGKVEQQPVEEAQVATDTDDVDVDVDDATVDGRCLNDIRFEGYERKDWLDNEYVRTLRSYLDAFNSRQIEDEELEPYRDIVKGKFVIFLSEPCIGGGMYIHITFINHPTQLFNAWVYSDVDIASETVSGYRVMSISKSEEPIEVTKEEILECVNKDPDLKLW